MNTTWMITIALLVSCSKAKETSAPVLMQKGEGHTSILSSYEYDDPDQVMVLSRSLSEISSLAYNSVTNKLYTNNDESGIYFILNKADGTIEEKIPFSKNGDYEGIEIINNEVIVSRNNGTLFFYDTISKETDKRKNKLKSTNNIEGLCYDSKTNRLLLACKGQPLGVVGGKKNKKCVYQYDLETQELDTLAYLTILDDDLIDFVRENVTTGSKSSIDAKVKRVKEFSPSGIAVHPHNDDKDRSRCQPERSRIL